MGLFSRSKDGNSSPSTTTTVRTQRIRTVDIDRPNQPYAGDPRDSDIPPFVRTSSYYKAGVETNPNYKYLQASDVRRQVQQAPSEVTPFNRYPKEYGNRPPLNLSAQPPYKEYPIMPSPRNGSAPRNYIGSENPGPIRSFYNDSDRSRFDVGYHDLRQPPSAPRNGKDHPRTPFSLAEYHPAPTYTTVRRR